METSLLKKTVETFVERDNNNNEKELKEELKMINNMSHQITNAL